MNTATSSKSHKIIRIIHGRIYDSYSGNWAGPVLTLVVSRQTKDFWSNSSYCQIHWRNCPSLEKKETGRQVHLTKFPDWHKWNVTTVLLSRSLKQLIKLWNYWKHISAVWYPDRCWCLCCEATPLIQMPKSWGLSWSLCLFAPAIPIPRMFSPGDFHMVHLLTSSSLLGRSTS